jgi:3D (Asp-Asp-Asp) domain-containing protein
MNNSQILIYMLTLSIVTLGSLSYSVSISCNSDINTGCKIANINKISDFELIPKHNSIVLDNQLSVDKVERIDNNIVRISDLNPDCSDDWYITGYYTPWEQDFPNNNKEKVIVNDIGERTYNKEFLEHVEREGDGKTLEGFYIKPDGDNTYNDLPYSTDYLGKKMSYDPVTVAVDPEIIPLGSKLTIPTLPQPWNNKTYIATDIGTSIEGKHIDVWTGEGKMSDEETFRLTSEDNSVCILP